MNGVHLRSEGKHWKRYNDKSQKERSDESRKAQKIKRIDGKHAHCLENTSDCLMGH